LANPLRGCLLEESRRCMRSRRDFGRLPCVASGAGDVSGSCNCVNPAISECGASGGLVQGVRERRKEPAAASSSTTMIFQMSRRSPEVSFEESWPGKGCRMFPAKGAFRGARTQGSSRATAKFFCVRLRKHSFQPAGLRTDCGLPRDRPGTDRRIAAPASPKPILLLSRTALEQPVTFEASNIEPPFACVSAAERSTLKDSCFAKPSESEAGCG